MGFQNNYQPPTYTYQGMADYSAPPTRRASYDPEFVPTAQSQGYQSLLGNQLDFAMNPTSIADLGKFTTPTVPSVVTPAVADSSGMFNFGITDRLKGMNSWMQDTGMIGSTKDGIQKEGWGGMLATGIGALSNAYFAMQQYGLAKESLQQNKEQFNKNYEANKKITNARLEGKAAARYRNNPKGHLSPEEYMRKHGVA